MASWDNGRRGGNAEEQTWLREPEVVGQARDQLIKRLRRWGLQDVEPDALLVLSELASNAVCHAEGQHFGTRFVLVPPHGVRIEVRDKASQVLQPTAPDTGALGGRGLLLVDSLADKWGVTRLPGFVGKTVWAELTAQPEAPS
ncbi:ATP-binding protein [Streptomyces jumonjinensis]|uniref:ATP-binding protein n=1 Tax=Streptomyces jumonjinensis TaxID=1945 RepID=UPI00378AC72F